jgi:acylphosphatase
MRREVFFEGRVQGVGFRFRTQEIAERFAVRGYVENLDDGRVHLIVEGESEETQRFLDAVQQALRANIRHMHVNAGAPTGEFDGFDIRR